jgi:hypothetical protein
MDTCTLRINHNSPAGGPSCTISGTATSCTDTADAAAIGAGSSADFQITMSSGAAATRMFPYIEFDTP